MSWEDGKPGGDQRTGDGLFSEDNYGERTEEGERREDEEREEGEESACSEVTTRLAGTRKSKRGSRAYQEVPSDRKHPRTALQQTREP